MLDKPEGLSSHEALFAAKKAMMSASLDTKKAGHTGTLDPMATGLLPLCFGEATKFAQFGLDADKRYHAIVRLGSATDTGDRLGQVVTTMAVPTITKQTLDEVASQFLGEQWQTPPMYSALKKDGKKLYEYARAGIEIERQPRKICIYKLDLTYIDEHTLAMEVACSKGVYVRVLGEDIAKALGTVGHLQSLRRLATGGFVVTDALSLEALTATPSDKRQAHMLPIECLLMHLPAFEVGDDECIRLQMGQRLNVKERLHTLPSFENACLVRLYHKQVFIGLGEVAVTGRLQPKKLVAQS